MLLGRITLKAFRAIPLPTVIPCKGLALRGSCREGFARDTESRFWVVDEVKESGILDKGLTFCFAKYALFQNDGRWVRE